MNKKSNDQVHCLQIICEPRKGNEIAKREEKKKTTKGRLSSELHTYFAELLMNTSYHNCSLSNYMKNREGLLKKQFKNIDLLWVFCLY